MWWREKWDEPPRSRSPSRQPTPPRGRRSQRAEATSWCRLASVGPYQLGIAWILRRRDDVDLVRPEIGGGTNTKVPSRVRAIEYQGSFVKVILDKIGDDEFMSRIVYSIVTHSPSEMW